MGVDNVSSSSSSSSLKRWAVILAAILAAVYVVGILDSGLFSAKKVSHVLDDDLDSSCTLVCTDESVDNSESRHEGGSVDPSSLVDANPEMKETEIEGEEQGTYPHGQDDPSPDEQDEDSKTETTRESEDKSNEPNSTDENQKEEKQEKDDGSPDEANASNDQNEDNGDAADEDEKGNKEEENQSDDQKGEHSNEKKYYYDTTYKCAEWIPEEQRKVLILDFPSLEDFNSVDGEDYHGACLDHALRDLGFDVVHRDSKSLDDESDLTSYYRIFQKGLQWHGKHYTDPAVGCRVRPFVPWADGERNQGEDPLIDMFDAKQVLTPYPEPRATFAGYFPHFLLERTSLPSLDREKVGLVYCNETETTDEDKAIMQYLSDDGFTVHAACHEECADLPKEVIRHENMGIKEVSELLPQMAFFLYLGREPLHPLPLEGLAHGVAFLNPSLLPCSAEHEDSNLFEDVLMDSRRETKVEHFRTQGSYFRTPLRERSRKYAKSREEDDIPFLVTQHDALAQIGMPYVYNVCRNDGKGVRRAARWSVKYRFRSHVPWKFAPDAMIRRLCNSIIEDDAICLCPDPLFGGRRKQYQEYKKPREDALDCRASAAVAS